MHPFEALNKDYRNDNRVCSVKGKLYSCQQIKCMRFIFMTSKDDPTISELDVRIFPASSVH